LSSLNDLATSLVFRFWQQGIQSDLDESIELQWTALPPFPLGHSLRSLSLNNLAASLGVRFKQRGILSDLDESIELHRAALWTLRKFRHLDWVMVLDIRF
jgi:hypothetical protein